MDLRTFIRDIPDFPKQGIMFKDLTTLLKDPNAFRHCIDELAKSVNEEDVDIVIGPEARGFTVGAPLAYLLNAGFVPVRKPGKLPAKVVSYEYELEYGSDKLEIHEDAIKPGQKVLIVDDLLATGGTALASAELVKKLGGNVARILFIVELSFLDGRERLQGYDVHSLIKY